MEQLELKASVRKSVGNGPARALRRQGKLPAILYGRKNDPVLLSIAIRDLEEIMKTGSSKQLLLNLVIENGGKSSRAAMIKELQIHPVSGQFLHVDFYEIDMEKKIKAMVPVTTRGMSKGVEFGGLLQIVRRELEVLCLPREIPEAIEVDITDLDVGDSLHVDEISLPGDLEIVADKNFTVVTILSPKVEAEAVEAEEEEAAEGVEAAAEGAPEEEASEAESES